MFNNSKYAKTYNRLMSRAQSRDGVSGYYERHHIIPKSLGGNNHPENIVKLTAREHYIAHLLLMKCFDDITRKHKMAAAFDYMSNVRNKYTSDRYTSRLFEHHKKIRSAIFSEKRKGKENPNYGKTHSEETRKKISDARIGVNTNTPESIEKKRQNFLNNNPNKNPTAKAKQYAAKAKPFTIQSPTGEVIKGIDLSKFCKQNNISQGNLVTYGKTKGWKIL